MFFSGSEVWGHRGWPSRYPDNTLAGIAAAGTVAAGVEIDIRRSADGRLVLSHDPDLGSLVVAESDWDDLRTLDVGGHSPALLDDVLDLDTPLDLEVKNHPQQPGFDADHRLALEVGERARRGDIVTSFWWPSMDALRANDPEVSTGLLVAGPMSPRAAIRHAVDHGHRSVAPEHGLIDEALVDLARSEGIEVVAWTVDDAIEALRLADLGVAAIITNRPGELIAEDPTTGAQT